VIVKTALRWLTSLLILLISACNLPFISAAPSPDAEPLPVSETRMAVPSDAWVPPPGTSWQWQLDGEEIDLTVDAEMFDVDLFETDASVVARLKDGGSRVICYISVGSWEDWRPDQDQFPTQALGDDYAGWPGEKWLDIRQIDLLAPVLRARFDLCKEKGFDGIEPDNIDGYTNETGFPLTYQDQIDFNTWLAQEAHARGLSIGLKNDSLQTGDLLPYFDWALSEDCFDQGWCEEFQPFIQAGKAVFAAEYSDTGITLQDFCQQAQAMGFSAILKNRELDAYREECSP
jgi:endo-alpha-1,4-polygalactosaminidase (GH114 family)